MKRPMIRIGTLMLLVAIVACALAGYRYYARFVRRTTVVYPVASLVLSPPGAPAPRDVDFQTLLNKLQATAMPGSWRGHGGNGTARPIYLTLSLQVEQSEAAHQAVAEFLRRLEDAARPRR